MVHIWQYLYYIEWVCVKLFNIMIHFTISLTIIHAFIQLHKYCAVLKLFWIMRNKAAWFFEELYPIIPDNIWYYWKIFTISDKTYQYLTRYCNIFSYTWQFWYLLDTTIYINELPMRVLEEISLLKMSRQY